MTLMKMELLVDSTIASSRDVPPDLLPSGFFSGSENIDGVRPEIVWMRSISHEFTKELKKLELIDL